MRGCAVPAAASALGATADNLEWHNELGGMTFNLGDRFVKWNPRCTGLDLRRERKRLDWLAGRHPAPRVITWDEDNEAQWMVTEALPGESAVGDTWRARTSEAITVIAHGLRELHLVPIADFPAEWPDEVWAGRSVASLGSPPPVDGPVLVHGDACAPNTLIDRHGTWVGHVDLGDLTVGDRWADLAIASMSLDWNFGPGHQDEFFGLYGVDPDPERSHYYRELWRLES